MSSRFLMRHRTVIQRNTTVSDTGGGYTDAWADIHSNVPCHAWWISSTQAVMAARPELTETRFVLVPKGTDVHPGDRLDTVKDKKGNVLFDGPLIVDSMGERKDHIQLMTRRIY